MTQDSPLVIAAIIPVFNRPRLITDALDSIAQQTRLPNQLIVVNDASTDHTESVVTQWFKKHPKLNTQLINLPHNQGVSAARNKGVQAAQLPSDGLIAFLDSDDLWPPNYLERGEQAMGSNPKLIAAVANRQDIYDDNGTPLQSQPNHIRCLKNLATQPTLNIFRKGPPGTPNTLIRQSCFDEIGGYDRTQMVGEDYQLFLRLSLLGPWTHLPGTPITVRKQRAANPNQANDENKAISLSKKYSDRRYRLATMLHQFIFNENGQHILPASVWRNTLGHMWYSAGRQLVKLDRKQESKQCFAYARQMTPWNLRAWLNW